MKVCLKMDKIFRWLLTVCLMLGLQVHLPVTMFPANDADHTAESSQMLDNLKLDRHNENTKLNTKPFTPNWVGAKAAGNSQVSKNDHFVRDTIKENIRLLNLTKNINPGVKRESIIGSTNTGLNQIDWNPSQAVFIDHRDLKSLRDLSETKPPFDTDKIKEVYEDKRLILKTEFIRKSLKQTHEKLLNISNIFTKNKKRLLSVVEEGHIAQVNKDLNNINNKQNTDHKQQRTTIKSSVYSYDNPSNKSGIDAGFSTNGIIWPDELVKKCPSAISITDQNSWKNKVQTSAILKIEEGCGNMQNRLITFKDSTKACVRYRLNSDLMQGEIYSYYLSRLLNIGYTTPTTLHMVDFTNHQWSRVQTDISNARWSDSKPLIFTQWIDNLEPVFMPIELRTLNVGIHADHDLLKGKSLSELCDLVQWSDLIVFDYMSANLDRVVNNMFNLKWNDKMMDKPIHNLEKSSHNGAFVFLDNESGLFHGYRLLDSHDQYHRKLLQSICVFRPETVRIIEKLYKDRNIGSRLVDLYISEEKYQNMLPRISAKSLDILQKRLDDVYRHIQSCKQFYSSKQSNRSPELLFKHIVRL